MKKTYEEMIQAIKESNLSFKSGSKADKIYRDIKQDKSFSDMVRTHGRDTLMRRIYYFVGMIEGNTPKKTTKEIQSGLKPVLKGSSATIDLNKYSHNLHVGFEFEFRPSRQSVNTESVAQHFNVRPMKTNGKSTKETYIQLIDGQRIKIPIMADLYKESSIVTQVYSDPSIGVEVVTRPVNIHDLDLVKPVHDYIKNIGDMNDSRAGLHMTFLLNSHKELSKWDNRVVANLCEFARIFYPQIILKFKNSNRMLRFRELNHFDTVQNPNQTFPHYHSISNRRENNETWAIEIRFPDGNGDFNKIREQVMFWSSVIRHCAKVSNKGILEINAPYFETVKDFYANYNPERAYNEQKSKIPFMMELIREELEYFTKQDSGCYSYEVI